MFCYIFFITNVVGMPRLDHTDDYPDRSRDKDLELPQIDLSAIIKATDNFSIDNKLGEGGFGPVYKVNYT